MDESPKTIGPIACAVFLVLGVLIGLGGLALILAMEFEHTRQLDPWVFGLLFIPAVYVIMKVLLRVVPILYIKKNSKKFPELQPNDFATKKWFIIGRTLSFLVFPFFTYLLSLLVWYFIKKTFFVSLVGLIGGWLVARVVQKTLFAREYV